MAHQQALRQEGFLGPDPTTGSTGSAEWRATFFTDPPFTTSIGESVLSAAGVPHQLSGRRIIADIEGDFNEPQNVRVTNLVDGGYVPGWDEPHSWR